MTEVGGVKLVGEGKGEGRVDATLMTASTGNQGYGLSRLLWIHRIYFIFDTYRSLDTNSIAAVRELQERLAVEKKEVCMKSSLTHIRQS